MKEIGINELKQIQLEILKEVHTYCVKENIWYSLSYGTLLGAIRHNGYIPWDDDIDIMMKREDYELFLQNFHHKYYKAICYNNADNYYQAFAKVYDTRTLMLEDINYKTDYGVYIDIFPIDNMTNQPKLLEKFQREKTFYNIIANLKIIKTNRERGFLKNTVLVLSHFILSPIPIRLVIDKISIISQKFRYAETSNAGIVVTYNNKLKWIVPKSYFNSRLLWSFENSFFYIISEYDKYLKAIYGDYMSLPPIENRISHHRFKAYWKNK